MSIVSKLKWVPDIPDKRDFYKVIDTTIKLPTVISMIPQFPEVYDQGNLGDCTGNSSMGAVGYLDVIDPNIKKYIYYSRLYVYYNSRTDKTQDTGASIRDVFKALNTYGVCPETEWTYDISKFAIKPPANCYKDGESNKIIKYARVNQDNTSLRTMLYQRFPIVFGMAVYDSFENVGINGNVPMPNLKKEKMLGGHCLLIVGANNKTKRYIVRNSWGNSWGDQGYCYIPYAMIEDADLCSDFWVAEKLEIQ